jgi:hypothetical protein
MPLLIKLASEYGIEFSIRSVGISASGAFQVMHVGGRISLGLLVPPRQRPLRSSFTSTPGLTFSKSAFAVPA